MLLTKGQNHSLQRSRLERLPNDRSGRKSMSGGNLRVPVKLEVNYILGTILAIFGDSYLLKHWRGTNFLNTWSQSCQLSQYPQILESDSQAGWVFTRYCQWFQSLQILETWRDSQTEWVFTQSRQWFWSPQILKSDSHPGWVFTRSCQWFWYPQTLESNSLPVDQILSVVLIPAKSGRGLTA